MPRPLKTERNDIGIALISLRLAIGDTQEEFAQRVGLSHTTIARYETNSRAPRHSIMVKLIRLARSNNMPETARTLIEASPDFKRLMDFEKLLGPHNIGA